MLVRRGHRATYEAKWQSERRRRGDDLRQLGWRCAASVEVHGRCASRSAGRHPGHQPVPLIELLRHGRKSYVGHWLSCCQTRFGQPQKQRNQETQPLARV
jgi:hypothetical protein